MESQVRPVFAPFLLDSALTTTGAAGSDLLGLLEKIDPTALDAESRVDLIKAFERVKAMVDGAQQAALAAVVDATTELGMEGESARFEVGAALRLAPSTAAERTIVASELVNDFPVVLAHLNDGQISWRQAQVLVQGVRDLPRDLANQVIERVLPKMPDQTVAETRRSTQAAVVAADPRSAAERHEKARKGRLIERLPQPDGMASWFVLMPADVEHELWTALNAHAHAMKIARRNAGQEDERTMDARRVDALAELLLGRRGDTTGGPAGGPPPTPVAATRADVVPRCSCGGRQVAAVILDLPTALGLADNPGHLEGYGAIPAPLARRMAGDRDWIRWVRDPGTRHIIDRGASTYRPSDKLKAFLTARDRVCGFPGCNFPARACDCDHVTVYREGGQTVAVNLGLLCRQHHNAKTHGRWQLTYDPLTNTKTWTSPLGRTYFKHSTPLLM